MPLNRIKTVLAGGACAVAIATAAQAGQFNVPGGDLKAALHAYAAQAQVQIIVADEAIRGAHTNGVHGDLSADAALMRILKGTGFTAERTPSGAIGVVRQKRNELRTAEVQAGIKHAAAAIETVTVTAQKRKEDIQLVPIAVTALSEKQLQEQKIEGGPDLLKTIPNVTFSKNNFTGYNFSIRGVGTKAISATTDPGVAVSFNNTTLIQNRLFEQEYFDVERVEVLRGPQGTLYGRNATSGVINVISAKPDLTQFYGSIKGEVGNYQSRRGVGMLNIPIIQDKLGVRIAGSYTSRDGYDYNEGTHNRVNGRNLWSTRATLGFHPWEELHGNLIWEHFNENDDRSRTGKQLCHRDPGPAMIGNTPVVGSGGSDPNNPYAAQLRPALFSQGCLPGSLYDKSAYGTPNGLALPFVFAMLGLGGDCGAGCSALYPLGTDSNGHPQTLLQVKDPYGGMMQSTDPRVISSIRDPKYRARADVYELNFDYDVMPDLTFTSQSAYDRDSVYSFQDYNRFNTVPVFTDTSQLYNQISYVNHQQDPSVPLEPSVWASLAPGGIFCDPQIGCSNSIAGFDISQGTSKQFSQEIRLQSDFKGPLNFSAGANYTEFKTLIDYYVMYNLISAYALMVPFNTQPDITKCGLADFFEDPANPPVSIDNPQGFCPYIDPNPAQNINGQGHNYFRSENPYSLQSKAAFGEVYYQLTDDLKLTAGLRYTDDHKSFTPVPSQILEAPSIAAGGTVAKGYPALPPIEQHWGEFTGRFNVSWMPKLDFTDQTMIYASYSRGYKGGGANPPSPGFATAQQIGAMLGLPQSIIDAAVQAHQLPVLELTGVEYGQTFKPEFVNAYEAGTKNTLLDGSMILNSDVFYYDYKDYQVSQIRDRTAVNENFDARIYGAEFETLWQPMADLRLNANFGYLHTSIGNGARSIDIMNRTQSNPGWVLVKPWAQLPSNCVVPVGVAENWLNNHDLLQGYWTMCGGVGGLLGFFASTPPTDPATGKPYDVNNYPDVNGGAGFAEDLKGKELPNSPHFTFNIGAEYTLHWIKDWNINVRGDFYHQSDSFARVYNDIPYDRLRGWNNANFSLDFVRIKDGLTLELYVKNAFNTTAITDAFLNSDDSALTTNVFVTDPRIVGFSVTEPF